MAPSQKRLTSILLALALTGSLVIGGLWWDSTRYETTWVLNKSGFRSSTSRLFVEVLGDYQVVLYPQGFSRVRYQSPYYSPISLFPKFTLGLGNIRVPYYLILLSHLATLTLLWFFLMNRLARREANKEGRAYGRPH